MIPGLKSIEEEVTTDGKTRIVFNIDDDKAEEFFKFLMLKNGDVAGLHQTLEEALNSYLNKEIYDEP